MIAAAHPLAHINAILNTVAGVLLVVGYYHIRQGREGAHRRTMMSAFLVSVVFLGCYVAHHLQVGSVQFTHTGAARGVYLAILLSHIVLAATVPPLAVWTIVLGYQTTGRRLFGGSRDHGGDSPSFDRQARHRILHRRFARWTLPIWIYVSVTGVVVYAMLYHIYPPSG